MNWNHLFSLVRQPNNEILSSVARQLENFFSQPDSIFSLIDYYKSEKDLILRQHAAIALKKALSKNC
jgi:hypothetical protein